MATAQRDQGILSIPYYIENSSFFVVLVPSALHEDGSSIRDLNAWKGRGLRKSVGAAGYFLYTCLHIILFW